MPELPRLKSYSEIAVTPRPTPNPEQVSQVQRTLAQGAGQLENVLGHIVAKDIHQNKAEETASARLAAENMVHDSFAQFTEATDKVRFGQVGYGSFAEVQGFADKDPNIPIQTDDLMKTYGHTQAQVRKAGINALAGHGPIAQYAFANEFDSLTLQRLQQLHTDRDSRKVGDLVGELNTANKNDVDYVANGNYSVQEGIDKFKDRMKTTGFNLMTPEQRVKMEKDQITALKLAPYMQRIANGQSDRVFMELEAGMVKDLSVEEQNDLRAKALKDNWEVESRRSNIYHRHKREFDAASDERAKNSLDKLRTGQYDRGMLQLEAPYLTREHYDFLDKAILTQETQGGVGAPATHASDKFSIALRPQDWTPDRIYQRVQETEQNPREGFDLLSTWFEASTKRKNAENDPHHFSKDHRYKMYYNGMKQDLGFAPFSVLKPADAAMVQQAQYDYEQAFQLAYDKQQPLPDFEKEHARIVKQYRPRMTFELDQPIPYDTPQKLIQDYKAGKISGTRFIEMGEALKKKIAAEKAAEVEPAK